MNSRSTTFPRNEERVRVCPVSPPEPTTGSVKSGATPDVVIEVDTVLVRELEVWGAGCVKEYTDQIATIIMIGIAIFSHLLRPCLFLATAALSWAFVLSSFLDFDDVHAPSSIKSIET